MIELSKGGIRSMSEFELNKLIDERHFPDPSTRDKLKQSVIDWISSHSN